MDDSRLVRLEEKIDHLLKYLEKRDEALEKQNNIHNETRDRLIQMEAKNQGAWFIITVFSGVIAFITTIVVSLFEGNK